MLKFIIKRKVDEILEVCIIHSKYKANKNNSISANKNKSEIPEQNYSQNCVKWINKIQNNLNETDCMDGL